MQMDSKKQPTKVLEAFRKSLQPSGTDEERSVNTRSTEGAEGPEDIQDTAAACSDNPTSSTSMP